MSDVPIAASTRATDADLAQRAFFSWWDSDVLTDAFRASTWNQTPAKKGYLAGYDAGRASLAADLQAAQTRAEEDRALFAELWTWVNSSPVKGSQQMAWVHGFSVDKEFSIRAGELWDRVEARSLSRGAKGGGA